jgi:hypothetical protein
MIERIWECFWLIGIMMIYTTWFKVEVLDNFLVIFCSYLRKWWSVCIDSLISNDKFHWWMVVELYFYPYFHFSPSFPFCVAWLCYSQSQINHDDKLY